MLSKDEEPHNPKYITANQCEKNIAGIKSEIDVIKRALVGDDMRGGIVKDMADVKSTLKGATGFFKHFILPVATSVITSLIISWTIINVH